MKSKLSPNDKKLFAQRQLEKEAQRMLGYEAKLANPELSPVRRRRRNIRLCAFSRKEPG